MNFCNTFETCDEYFYLSPLIMTLFHDVVFFTYDSVLFLPNRAMILLRSGDGGHEETGCRCHGAHQASHAKGTRVQSDSATGTHHASGGSQLDSISSFTGSGFLEILEVKNCGASSQTRLFANLSTSSL